MSELLKFRLVKGIFAFGYFFYMFSGLHVSGQSMQALQRDVIESTQRSMTNTGKIGVLEMQVQRNTEDIRALIASNAEVAKAMNQFTGIGVGVGALGSIIVILQAVSLIKKPRSGQ